MSILEVTEIPEPTTEGPVADYLAAVQRQYGTFRTGQAYRFGKRIVRFYDGETGEGMDVFTPVKGSKTPDLYHRERITPRLKRYPMGFYNLELEPVSP